MYYLNRPAIESDLLAISNIIEIASVDGVGIEGSVEELRSWQKANCSVDLIKTRINDSSTLLLVSEILPNKEGLIGLVGTGFAQVKEDGQGYIGGLYCLARGKGVGSGLINGLSNWLIEHKARNITMVVAGGNKRMLSLANKLGFEAVGLERGEFFVNGTWLIMEKIL